MSDSSKNFQEALADGKFPCIIATPDSGCSVGVEMTPDIYCPWDDDDPSKVLDQLDGTAPECTPGEDSVVLGLSTINTVESKNNLIFRKPPATGVLYVDISGL